MFKENRIEGITPNEGAGNDVREGFEKFEDKYHKAENDGLSEVPEQEREELLSLFEVDAEKVTEAVDIIDTYIEQKTASGMDVEHADVDEIFDENDFIELIKPLGETVAVPAICYWSMLKQTFIEYRDFESAYNGNEKDYSGQHKGHETRVRAVTELLLASFPPALMATLGYKIVAGKELEVLDKIDKNVSEKIVAASDAALYLTASAGIGCLRIAENAVGYVGTSLETLAGNKEGADKIMSLDISGDLKKKLDDVYGRDDWAATISSSVEKFGAGATYLGLTTLLPVGGIKAIAGGVGLALGKAGETLDADYKKTGEVTPKEIEHGAIAGAVMLGCAELGVTAADKLGTFSPAIAKEINDIFGGKIDPKLLKSITASAVNGLEAGTMFAAYDTPEQVSKDVGRALGIDPEAKGDWKKTLDGVGVAILTAATFTLVKELYVNRGFYSTYEDRINRTPVDNGEWTGKRGESKFVSNSDEVAKYHKDANVDGVNYKNGCPDFKPFSKGEVKIPNMSPDRHTTMGKTGNFEQADAALAKLRGNGCTARDVANWRKANGYTWHELNDMKTCQKVPTSINKIYRHLGGVSECKRRDDMLNEIIGKHTSKGGIFDE